MRLPKALNTTDATGAAADLSVLHCVHREGLAGVFASQVLKPVRGLREAGVCVGLVTMQPVGEWFRGGPRRAWREQRRAIREALGGRGGVRLPSPPSRFRRAWDDTRVFTAWLRWFGGSYGVLHCRGSEMANIAIEARRRIGRDVRIVFDCRGVDHAERVYSLGVKDGDPIPEHVRGEWEARRDAIESAVHGADAVVCVSEAMADSLCEEFGARAEKMTVCPCAVDLRTFAGAAERGREIRERLGVQERFVVVYCGSTRAWQLPEQAVRTFERIRREEPSAFFLAVTPQVERMGQLLDEAGVAEADRHVTSAAHDAVPGYLGAGDAGLLLREPCLVNRVASPVKFAEYVASGLPVILTEGIGDYSGMVAREGIGCVVPYADLNGDDAEPLRSFVADVRANRPQWRQRCERVAREQLSLDEHCVRVVDLYRRLESAPVPEGGERASGAASVAAGSGGAVR